MWKFEDDVNFSDNRKTVKCFKKQPQPDFKLAVYRYINEYINFDVKM